MLEARLEQLRVEAEERAAENLSRLQEVEEKAKREAEKKVAEEKADREARQKELFDQAAAREAEREAVSEERRRNDDSRRNEAWSREIDEEYEIWLRLKKAENEEAFLRREKLAQAN